MPRILGTRFRPLGRLGEAVAHVQLRISWRLIRFALSWRPRSIFDPKVRSVRIPTTIFFGLLAATGLRISEALALRRDDLTDDGLIVRNGKFGKSRLLPLHATTRQALIDYMAIRKRLGSDSDDMFVVKTGRAPSKVRAHVVFVRLARQLGLRGPDRTPGPRLYDLRHTFAVSSLEACAHDREAVAHHMAALSTYLGHADILHTYWYLEATPVLMHDIAAASERLFQEDVA
jgi:integrase/recombinase XerD